MNEYLIKYKYVFSGVVYEKVDVISEISAVKAVEKLSSKNNFILIDIKKI